MNKQDFFKLKLGLLKYLEEHGFCHSTLCGYKSVLHKIECTLPENDWNDIDADVLKPYVEILNRKFEKRKISQHQYNLEMRTCCRLLNFSRTGAVSFSPIRRSDLNPQFIEIINRMITNENWSPSRRRNCRDFSNLFFAWCQQCGFTDLNELREIEIKQYIRHCANRMTNRSIALVRYYTRLLFDYLFEQGYIETDLTSAFSFVVHIEHKVQKPIPPLEIAMVLNSIDINTPLGKRDYAIIITALTTGLRASDIVNLKRSNFDWRNGLLKITQVKTGKEILLPLTKDYGNAIIDYILNARPPKESDFIFLSSRPPFDVLLSSSLRGILASYQRKCNLPRTPFHSIRRTLGTAMVVGGTGIDLIPDVLGQSSIASTRPYVIADTNTMSECSLPLSSIPYFEEDSLYE